MARRLKTFKLTLAYDGTSFKGWQRLPGKARTVQGTVEQALSTILDADIDIAGAGRTDAGAHAEGQVASFSAATMLEPDELATRLGAGFPTDLACVACESAPARFHARYWPSTKTYRFRVLNRARGDPFLSRYSLLWREALDLDAMRRAAEVFIGGHDFSSFTNLKDKEKNLVRTVSAAAVEQTGDIVDLRFSADGFLYNMARIMAAAVLEAGAGRLTADAIREILEARDRSLAPGAAPAHGLCLESVRYEDS